METMQIVEDHHLVLSLLKGILERSGYDVIPSYDGVEALSQFQLEQPDLLITDLMLPGLDGYELCRSVRELSNIPILVVTGGIEKDGLDRAIRAGADSFLKKPFDIAELLAQIDALLAKHRAQQKKLQNHLRSVTKQESNTGQDGR